MPKKGVDISQHNGNVDFVALKNEGIEFVIIRAGYGKDYPGQQDNRFLENVEKAEAAGMPWGAYHYSYARDKAAASQEAEHILRLLGRRKPSYGVWYDMEDSSTLGGDLAGAAEAFCSAVQAAGLYAGVYANLNWWNNYLTSPVFDRFDRWCAQYNSTCGLKKPYGIWQFTDKLVIGGKAFDGNWAYKDYPALTGKEEKEMRYNTINEIPSWAQPTISKLCDKHLLNGNGGERDQYGYPADLNLSLDMIRVFVVNDNAGLYD